MNELIGWIAALGPAMAFLFALPFVVAAAGLLADRSRSTWAKRRERERDSRADARYASRRREDRHAWG